VDPLVRRLGARPQIAESLDSHIKAVMETGTVAARSKELCALMVSALNRCEY
jgi:hypothetical protein